MSGLSGGVGMVLTDRVDMREVVGVVPPTNVHRQLAIRGTLAIHMEGKHH